MNSIYGIGVSIAYRAYSLASLNDMIQKDRLFDSYVLIIMFTSIFGNIMSCSSRFMLNKMKRSFFRLAPFVVLYILISIPLIYRFMFYYYPAGFLTAPMTFIFSFFSSNSTINVSFFGQQIQNKSAHSLSLTSKEYYGVFKNKSDIYYAITFMGAAASAFIYSTHIPERFWPGKFDLYGSSHQVYSTL